VLDENLAQALGQVLQGLPTELTRSVIWNGGFYLWRAGAVATLADGFARARVLLETGQVQAKCEQIKDAIATVLDHQLSIV
ncbi:MAG: hypothetical protein AAF808_10005, partial [Cyanobacteria bacterium P01_D01_bin.2]